MITRLYDVRYEVQVHMHNFDFKQKSDFKSKAKVIRYSSKTEKRYRLVHAYEARHSLYNYQQIVDANVLTLFLLY